MKGDEDVVASLQADLKANQSRESMREEMLKARGRRISLNFSLLCAKILPFFFTNLSLDSIRLSLVVS